MKNNLPFDYEKCFSAFLKRDLDDRISSQNLESRIMHTIRHSQISKRSGIDRRWQFAGIFVLACLAVLLSYPVLKQSPPLTVYLFSQDGTVILNGKEKSAQDIITEIGTSDILKTQTTQVSITLDENAAMVLDTETQIRYVSKGKIKLDQGSLYYSHYGKKGADWAIITPLGTVAPIGTEFDLSYRNGELTLNVLDGNVMLYNDVTKSRIQKGQNCRVRNGIFEIKHLDSPYDRWWPAPMVPWTEYLH